MAREMKDSGIEWIGKIPSDWNVVRIKNLADNHQKNSFIDGDWIESPDITDSGIRYLTTGNVGDGQYKQQGNGFITVDTFNRLNCKYAYPGDLVIARLNAPYGRACILPNDYPKYVLAVDIVILRTLMDKHFLCYQMQCSGYQHAIEDDAKGTTMRRISRTNLGKIPLVIAPLDVQHRIASFLDQKCSEIDSVIAKTQATIEEYKALKQSIITEAVTKGVRGDRPMKYSGIEWIGEIPGEWECMPIKYVAAFQPTCDTSTFTDDTEITYTPMDCIKNGFYIPQTAKYGTVSPSLTPYEEGDIVIAKVTPCFENGNIAIMENLASGFGMGSSELFVFRATGVNTRYLLYWLQNDKFKAGGCATMTGTGGLKRVSPYYAKNAPILLPSFDEQIEIVNDLDAKCAEIERLIEKKQLLLTELESYKKSVIYEYVTGKKEVPDASHS